MPHDNNQGQMTRNVYFARLSTRDKVPEDKCRQCGEIVRFGTDGFGRLIALNRDTLERHPCRSS